MENSIALEAKILTVSDGVVVGERKDISGGNLQKLLEESGWIKTNRAVFKDGSEPVASAIIELAEGFHGLIVTTGGTGFGPRDQTPEGSRKVLEI